MGLEMVVEHFYLFEMLIKFVGNEFTSPELKAQCPFLEVFRERGGTLHIRRPYKSFLKPFRLSAKGQL